MAKSGSAALGCKDARWPARRRNPPFVPAYFYPAGERLKEWQQGVLSFLLIMLALAILFLAIHWITGVEFF